MEAIQDESVVPFAPALRGSIVGIPDLYTGKDPESSLDGRVQTKAAGYHVVRHGVARLDHGASTNNRP